MSEGGGILSGMCAAEQMRVVAYVGEAEVSASLRASVIECWIDVTNAGGAAGFPFPPVNAEEVAPVVAGILRELHPDRCRLLTAVDQRGLLGWAVLRRGVNPLIAHCGSLHHVQSHPKQRGEGVGSLLVNQARELARDELGLQQLQLAVRAGVGLETFYGRLGWREVGRWPGALRLAADDYRDEVLMHLPLTD